MNIPRIALVLLASLVCVGCSHASGGGEKVVERYESGQKKSEGYMLDDGKKVGHWTYWHENGPKYQEGEFKNGKQEGRWIGWYENGQRGSEVAFKNGKQEGLWTSWHENGQYEQQGEYKNGKEEGLWTTWHDNGQKQAEVESKNGKPEGRWTCWRLDGSINHVQSGIYKAGTKIADLPKKKS